jgi:hypothetical protein
MPCLCATWRRRRALDADRSRGGELAGRGMAVNAVDARATAEHSSRMGMVCDFLRGVTVIDNLGITYPRTMFYPGRRINSLKHC